MSAGAAVRTTERRNARPMLVYCCFDIGTSLTYGKTFRYTRNSTTESLERALQLPNLRSGGGEYDVHAPRGGETHDPVDNAVTARTKIDIAKVHHHAVAQSLPGSDS